MAQDPTDSDTGQHGSLRDAQPAQHRKRDAPPCKTKACIRSGAFPCDLDRSLTCTLRRPQCRTSPAKTIQQCTKESVPWKRATRGNAEMHAARPLQGTTEVRPNARVAASVQPVACLKIAAEAPPPEQRSEARRRRHHPHHAGRREHRRQGPAISSSRPPPPTSPIARCTETRACARPCDSGSCARTRCAAASQSPCWTRKTRLQDPSRTTQATHDDHVPDAGQNIQISDLVLHSFTAIVSTAEESDTAHRRSRLHTKTRPTKKASTPQSTLHPSCSAEVGAIADQQLRQRRHLRGSNPVRKCMCRSPT